MLHIWSGQMFYRPVKPDVSEASQQARHQLLLLISESMEARMQSYETLLQLRSTMKSIQQLRAVSGPGCFAGRPNEQPFHRMIAAESLHQSANP